MIDSRKVTSASTRRNYKSKYKSSGENILEVLISYLISWSKSYNSLRVIATEMSKQFDVTIVGSIFMDLISYSSRLPLPGETLIGDDFKKGFGGKGANQCVAAQRLGAKSCFIGKLGEDDHGSLYCQHLRNEGVNVDGIEFVKDVPTGVASILVGAEDGQNLIVVVPGATGLVDSEYVQSNLNLIKQSKVLICQLEISLEATFMALKLGKKTNAITILNIAPAVRGLPSDMFSVPDIICLNETEAEIVTGVTNVQNKEQAKLAIEKLRYEFNSNSVIITLGAEGALVWDHNAMMTEMIRAPVVTPVVDSTGAGDCFIGTLAYCLTKGESLIESCRKAVKNASECVKLKGTQSSFPYQLID